MITNPTGLRDHGVLCGTDFSTDLACALAKNLHEPVDLVHVHAGIKGPPPESRLSEEATRPRQRGIEIHKTLLEGSADEALAKRAKRKSCLLVVLASVGKRVLKRWVPGSVSESTAGRPTVPALVVRPSAPFLAWMRGERALKVFVAFSHAPTSDASLIWVENLQSIRPCEVVVGFVDSPPEQVARLDAPGDVELPDSPRDFQSILNHELKAPGARLIGLDRIQNRVEPNWGWPDAALASMAMQEGADVLFVGSHQHDGFERLWKTSGWSGWLHTAAMSVVPLATGMVKTAGLAPTDGKGLATTDFSDLADLTIAHAYSLLRSGGTLHLVKFVQPHELPGAEIPQGPLDRDIEKQHARYIRLRLEKLRALIPAEAVGRGIQTEVEVVEHTDARDAISQAAERFGADTIPMSTHDRSGLPKVVLGSVAQKVLTRNSRPLPLVRSPVGT